MMKRNDLLGLIRMLLVASLGLMPFAMRLYGALDARIELAEYLSVVEALRHVKNRDDLVLNFRNQIAPGLMATQSDFNRSLLIGDQYVFLERYFYASNQGFKSYVNLVTMEAVIVGYGVRCKELVPKNIDKMTCEAKDWLGIDSSDSLTSLVLDFILPDEFTILTCIAGENVKMRRYFERVDNAFQIQNNSVDCEDESNYFIYNPHLNILSPTPIYATVKGKWNHSRSKLRFYHLAKRCSFASLVNGYGGSVSGPLLIFDF